MLRILTALAFCASAAVAQDKRPILTNDGQPIKVIIGTKVINSKTQPLASLESPKPEILPMPRVLATDNPTLPKRVGWLTDIVSDTIRHFEVRGHVARASHKTLGDIAPNILHESIRENTAAIIPTPLPPQEVHVTHTATTAEAPHFTTVVLQQTVAILIAVVILALLTIAAYFLVLRKYVPFQSLFQVQIVGSGVPVALTSEPKDSFADITPNFEMGPTYEEELTLKALASERQEMAVLAHIADLNLTLQQELQEQGLLSTEAHEGNELETVTHSEDPLTHPEPAV
jgi:hypothetical protein